MLSLSAATLGLILAILLPGIALVYLLGRRRTPWWEAIAVVPALGLGFIYVVAEVASVVRIRFDVPILAISLTGLAIFAIVFAIRRRGRSAESRIVWPERLEYGALALLGLAIILGSVIWAMGLRGVEVPPNFDATHHGLFTAQIDRFGTIDADRVLVSSNADTDPTSSFYPLALHSATALVSGTAPTTIADIWLALAALFGAVVFPIGIFALTRTLIPSVSLAAGFAALLAPAMALFPYKPLAWGGVALIAGLAMMPGVVVAGSAVLTRPASLRHSGYVAFALVGLFASHSSELPLAIALTVIVASTSMGSLGATVWLKRVLANGALIGLFSVALLTPVLVPVLRGGSERLGFDDKPLAPLGPTVRSLLDLSAHTNTPATILVVLAGIGALVALIRRTALVWLATGAAVVALYIAISVSDNPIAATLSFPWYRQPERVLYNVVFWLLPFAGLALGVMTIWIARHVHGKWKMRMTLVAVLVAVFALMLPSMTPIPALMQSWTGVYSTVGGDEIAAFEYLATVVQPDEPVLTDLNADGSLWMYAFTGVDPLFLTGFSTLADTAVPASVIGSFESRRSLVVDIGSYRALPGVADRLEDAGIRYVYYDETGFPGSGRALSYESLRTDPAFVPVFEQGAAHVYRIDYEVLRDPDRFTVSRPVLVDGGFDEGMTYWSPDSQTGAWWIYSSDRSAISVHDIEGQSVLYAVRGGEVQGRAWSEIAVSPVHSYAVEVSIFSESPSRGAVFAGLSFFDEAGVWISNSVAGTGDLENLEPGVWYHFSQDIYPPDRAVIAVPVVIAVDIDGEIRVDDFDLRIRYGRT